MFSLDLSFKLGTYDITLWTGQINLGKIYIVGDRSKVKYLIFLGTSRFY